MVNKKYETINQWAWNNRSGLGKIGRLTSANLSFGMNFNSKSKKDKNNVAGDEEGEEEDVNRRPAIYDEYVDFSLPWNFGFDYSFNYSGPSSGAPDGRFSQTLGIRGNVSLTEKWKVAMNTNFDIQAREFSYTSLNISRDLHCWQMTFNFVPFGYMKSYSFTINAKSAMLKDLMLKKQESHYDNF